jgi:hypothetical protein
MLASPPSQPNDIDVHDDSVTVTIRDEYGQEWSFTDVSTEDAAHVVTIKGPEGDLPTVMAQSPDELRRRLEEILFDHPDILELLP